jgi:hypothetical protein
VYQKILQFQAKTLDSLAKAPKKFNSRLVVPIAPQALGRHSAFTCRDRAANFPACGEDRILR